MDIVERLRIRADLKSPNDFVKQRRIETEAADEIDRLRKQAHYHYENGLKKDVDIESLRDALRWAGPFVKDNPRVSAIVKAALKGNE